MLGDRGSTLDLAARALLRGALVGVALVGPGLACHAVFFGLNPASALGEAAFDLSVGLFVVAPAALLEHLSQDRDPPALPLEVALGLTLPLAAVGAAGAFLQGLYARAVLQSGSLEDGLEQVTRGAEALLVLRDLTGLFLSIAVVAAAASLARRRVATGAASRGTTEWLALCVCAALLGGTGVRGPALGVSASMLVALTVALAFLRPVADALAARVRAWREARS